jgi:hypothetical protein
MPVQGGKSRAPETLAILFLEKRQTGKFSVIG